MSGAMRSTLQTVPESLEVTKNADPSISVKTPASKTSTGEATNQKSRAYNYYMSSNKVSGIKL